MEHCMSTLELKELSHPAGEVIKIASGKTLDLKTQGSVTMPTGSVLQVVSVTNTTTASYSTTSWVDTNLSLTITPSSASSKIHLQYVFQNIDLGPAPSGCAFRFLRDSTSLFTPTANYSEYTNQGSNHRTSSNIAIDSPSTTSSITYKVQIACYHTTGVGINSGGNFKDTIIAMEIQG
jgi:hypothetical protein